MNDEPPSISAESSRLGFRKRVKDKIKEIYQNFSYKPQNKQELAGSIRDSSARGVLEKGTLNMIEGALMRAPSIIFKVPFSSTPLALESLIDPASSCLFWGL